MRRFKLTSEKILVTHEFIESAYRTHLHSVMRRAQQLLGAKSAAEDVAHEVFANLLAHPHKFEGRSKILTWLYSAVTHACLNRIRNEKTRRSILERRSKEMTSTLRIDSERYSILRDLLTRIPEDLAQVAVYYYADEMTHEEIATVMNCSRRHIGDLVQRMHRAVEEVEQHAT